MEVSFMNKFFTDEELECSCCGELEMDQDFMCLLSKLRAEFDHPMIVTSGFRCQSHNAAVGGSDRSKHLLGCAVDVYWEDYNSSLKYRLVECALGYDVRGIGLSDEFIHLDGRNGAGKIWFY